MSIIIPTPPISGTNELNNTGYTFVAQSFTTSPDSDSILNVQYYAKSNSYRTDGSGNHIFGGTTYLYYATDNAGVPAVTATDTGSAMVFTGLNLFAPISKSYGVGTPTVMSLGTIYSAQNLKLSRNTLYWLIFKVGNAAYEPTGKNTYTHSVKMGTAADDTQYPGHTAMKMDNTKSPVWTNCNVDVNFIITMATNSPLPSHHFS